MVKLIDALKTLVYVIILETLYNKIKKVLTNFVDNLLYFS